MRWESEERSDNVEDRRGLSIGRGGAIGGGAVVLAVVAYLLGAPASTVRDILTGGGAAPATGQAQGPRDPAEERQLEFVKVVLRSTETTWSALFSARGSRYELPKLVVFSGEVASACGQASAAVGPFYCPPDHQVYLDLEFFAELERRFAAPGDFARAYVVAHEVGHHVQNLLGISDKVQAARERSSEVEANRLSVRTELQADCLAGVWAYNANRTRHILEPGDAEAGLNAASAIGDDTLQKRARGRVSPESFTHGSSAQRVKWFKTGMESGKIDQCDTFAAGDL
jgi:predicted metalloprotease